jgi:hypothetical protein
MSDERGLLPFAEARANGELAPVADIRFDASALELALVV